MAQGLTALFTPGLLADPVEIGPARQDLAGQALDRQAFEELARLADQEGLPEGIDLEGDCLPGQGPFDRVRILAQLDMAGGGDRRVKTLPG